MSGDHIVSCPLLALHVRLSAFVLYYTMLNLLSGDSGKIKKGGTDIAVP